MDFLVYPKTPRLFRNITVTEKIDGTCSCVAIKELDGHPDTGALWTSGGLALYAGSRSRWITPAADNHGFARWVLEHAEELMQLGPGRHFGEWWGRGIQRGYGLTEKRFSLFNVARFCAHDATPAEIPSANPTTPPKYQQRVPACCHLVPVLKRDEPFAEATVVAALGYLQGFGSLAAPGFMRPEGIIVFHEAAQRPFKVLLENDNRPKGE